MPDTQVQPQRTPALPPPSLPPETQDEERPTKAPRCGWGCRKPEGAWVLEGFLRSCAGLAC